MDNNFALVTEVNKMIDPSQISVALNAGRPTDLIPKEEQALVEVPKYQLDWMLTPTVNMAQITGVLDDNLFAMVCVSADGRRVIKFCQRYDSGDYSAVMEIKQADLILAVQYGGKAREDDSAFVARQRRKALRVTSAFSEEYYGKFCRGIPLPLVQLLQALFVSVPHLPEIREDQGHLEPRAFYDLLREKINEYFQHSNIRDLHEKRTYFALIDNQLDEVAQMMGMTKQLLLKKLNEYNLLYLTPSCRGYQVKVRFDANTLDWAYCIYKLEALNTSLDEKE